MVQTCRRPWSSHRYKHSQRIVDVTVVFPREVPTIQSVQKMVWTLSVSISIEGRRACADEATDFNDRDNVGVIVNVQGDEGFGDHVSSESRASRTRKTAVLHTEQLRVTFEYVQRANGSVEHQENPHRGDLRSAFRALEDRS